MPELATLQRTFETLLQDAAIQARKVLMSLFHDRPEDVEDALQTAAVKAWNVFQSSAGLGISHEKFTRYFIRAAINTVYSIIRKEKRLPVDRLEDLLVTGNEPGYKVAFPDGENLALWIFRSLSKRYQTLLYLRGEGYSYQRISKATGRSVCSVKLGLFRARKIFMQRLVARGLGTDFDFPSVFIKPSHR